MPKNKNIMNKVIIENGLKIVCIDDKKYKILEIPAVIERMDWLENNLNETNEYLLTLSDEVERAKAEIQLIALNGEKTRFIENLGNFITSLSFLDVDDDNHTFGVAFKLFFELELEEGYELLKNIEIPAVRDEKISKALAQQFMLKLNFCLFLDDHKDTSREEYDKIISNVIKYYKEVFKINKDDFETSDILSTIYFKKKEYEEALIYCKKLVELKPNHPVLLSNLGDCYFETQNNKKAITCFREAIKLAPNIANIWIRLADAYYFEEGEIDQVINCYLEALKIEPRDTEVNASLASIYEEKQDLEKAIHYYEKAISFGTDQMEDYENLARCYNDAGFSFKAIGVYKHILTLFPQDYDILLNVADIYKNEEKYSKAIEFYHKALVLKPFDPQILWDLCFAYSVKKNKKETLYYLEQHIINYEKFGEEGKEFFDDAQEFLWLKNDTDFRKLVD